MVERDGKPWYWCEKHKFKTKEGVVTNGMYVTHKPDEHDAEKRNKDRKWGTAAAAASTGNDPASKPTTTPSISNDSSASKLSLSKSLQAALVTTAGITEDQFKKIWAEACNASGN
jgi:hypothetical protein